MLSEDIHAPGGRGVGMPGSLSVYEHGAADVVDGVRVGELGAQPHVLLFGGVPFAELVVEAELKADRLLLGRRDARRIVRPPCRVDGGFRRRTCEQVDRPFRPA
jgi:hypothetical protein